jgi:glycosyltransferase involved in cell wall biosynthesis
MKYSICITHYNNFKTIRKSLLSIISQVNDDFEIIVVDSKSNDGSQLILREFSDCGKIKLIEQKCSRGKGRQLAFENSTGDIVISNIDMDEIYKPRINEMLSLIHGFGDFIFLVTSSNSKEERGLQNITVGKRTTINEVGGWRDVNYGEDWDLWRRAALKGKFRRMVFEMITSKNYHKERRGLSKFAYRYFQYRDMIKLGRNVFGEEERVSPKQKLIYYLAKVSIEYKRFYENNVSFDVYDDKYLTYGESAKNERLHYHG